MSAVGSGMVASPGGRPGSSVGTVAGAGVCVSPMRSVVDDLVWWEVSVW